MNAESRNENGGAGIGGGSSTTIGQEKGGHGGTIAIGGSAKVTAYGQDGAGIGGGGNGNSGKITITGGVVTAYGYCGAGIGGGKNGNGEDISISGGIVYAYGTYYGSIYPAAIGGGGIEATGSGSGSQHAGKITISDGTVIATVSDANMTAIGGKSGQSTDAISINGGTVIATGAGIGKSESESAITTYLTENKPVIFATAINGYTSADGDAIVVGTDEVQFQSVTFGGEGPASSGTLLLQEGFTIPADGTLTIPPGWTLNLNGKTITNKGTIINGGTINDNGGTISNDGGTIE